MKITKKHIFNLLASLLCLLSVSAKTNDSKDVAKYFPSTNATEITKATSDKLAVFDLVEEVTVSHFSQTDSEDFIDFTSINFNGYISNRTFNYLFPSYTSAIFEDHTNKQQLLLLIFPFHYFY